MTTDIANNSTEAWENYWQGSQRSGSIGTGGAQDPALRMFWTHYFEEILRESQDSKLLDIGCGSGAVTEFAQQAAQSQSATLSICALDSSASAIAHIKQQYPEVVAVCASAADTSLEDQSFDHIVSQFGLEYAGVDALPEVARLLRPGGTFAALLHMRGGAIDRECASDQKALQEVLASGLFSALVHLFKESLALRKGEGSRVGFELADKALNPCVQVVRGVLAEHGEQLAGGLLHRIYADIAHMYQNMKTYDPDEVIAWSDNVEAELTAFSHRLESMQAAAIDEAALAQNIALLAQHGVSLSSQDVLCMGEANEPAAWVLLGHK